MDGLTGGERQVGCNYGRAGDIYCGLAAPGVFDWCRRLYCGQYSGSRYPNHAVLIVYCGVRCCVLHIRKAGCQRHASGWLAAAGGEPIYLRYLKMCIPVERLLRHTPQQQPWTVRLQHLCCYSDSYLHDRRCPERDRAPLPLARRRQGLSTLQYQRGYRPRNGGDVLAGKKRPDGDGR